MFERAKKLFEETTKVRIFRNSLPHGVDLFRDLSKVERWSEEPRVIVDIGAHTGETVARFRSIYPAAIVYAFEPASANRSVLEATFGSDSKVVIHASALGSHSGAATLHLAAHSAMHSLVQRDTSTSAETIAVVTLDDFCEQHAIQRIGFCKIDTEGFDLEVLRGATRILLSQSIDFVQVETTFRRDTTYFAPFTQIDEFMNSHRYELFGLYEQQPCWSGRNSLLYLNAVYVRTTLVDNVPSGF